MNENEMLAFGELCFFDGINGERQNELVVEKITIEDVRTFVEKVFNESFTKSHLDYLQAKLDVDLIELEDNILQIIDANNVPKDHIGLIAPYVKGDFDIWLDINYYSMEKKKKVIKYWLSSITGKKNDLSEEDIELCKSTLNVIYEWTIDKGLKEAKELSEKARKAENDKRRTGLTKEELEKEDEINAKMKNFFKAFEKQLDDKQVAALSKNENLFENVSTYLKTCKENYRFFILLDNEMRGGMDLNVQMNELFYTFYYNGSLKEFFSDYMSYTEGSPMSVDKARFIIRKLKESIIKRENLSLYSDYSKVKHMAEKYPNEKAYWSPNKLEDTTQALMLLQVYIPNLAGHFLQEALFSMMAKIAEDEKNK